MSTLNDKCKESDERDSHHLKMLGMYLHTLIIGHKSCKMLSILKQLTLQKTFQNCVTNHVFLYRKVKPQQQQSKKSNIKPLPEPEIEPGIPRTQSGYVTSARPSQLKVTIVVKLHVFNLFDAMARNVNKQSRICGPQIFNKFLFCNIFLCTDNYIWQFLIFTVVGFTA